VGTAGLNFQAVERTRLFSFCGGIKYLLDPADVAGACALPAATFKQNERFMQWLCEVEKSSSLTSA
jgi:hypothetical protein